MLEGAVNTTGTILHIVGCGRCCHHIPAEPLIDRLRPAPLHFALQIAEQDDAIPVAIVGSPVNIGFIEDDGFAIKQALVAENFRYAKDEYLISENGIGFITEPILDCNYSIRVTVKGNVMSQASSSSVTTDSNKRGKRIAAIIQLCASRGTHYRGIVDYLHMSTD